MPEKKMAAPAVKQLLSWMNRLRTERMHYPAHSNSAAYREVGILSNRLAAQTGDTALYAQAQFAARGLSEEIQRLSAAEKAASAEKTATGPDRVAVFSHDQCRVVTVPIAEYQPRG